MLKRCPRLEEQQRAAQVAVTFKTSLGDCHGAERACFSGERRDGTFTINRTTTDLSSQKSASTSRVDPQSCRRRVSIAGHSLAASDHIGKLPWRAKRLCLPACAVRAHLVSFSASSPLAPSCSRPLSRLRPACCCASDSSRCFGRRLLNSVEREIGPPSLALPLRGRRFTCAAVR